MTKSLLSCLVLEAVHLAGVGSYWGLGPWGFAGGPFGGLGGANVIDGFLQPSREVALLFDAVDVGLRRVHEERLVAEWWTFGADGGDAVGELLDEFGVLGGDVILLAGVVEDVVEDAAHELEVAFADSW